MSPRGSGQGSTSINSPYPEFSPVAATAATAAAPSLPPSPTLSYPRYLLSAMASSLASPSQLLSSRPTSPTSSLSIASSSPPSTPLMSSGEAGPSSARSRIRGLWGTMKNFGREECEDEPMHVDDHRTASISLVLPPSLPICSLVVDLQLTEGRAEVPPAFYPGQSIPVILTFSLDRFASLPHALNSVLTMSLVGTLYTATAAPRTIICVSVSLAEGLALWARDARNAYKSKGDKDHMSDPALGLPGGTYSLPLTVQVPSTPRLPPTFAVPGSAFTVTYALTVDLTCDDQFRPGSRAVLAEADKPFEMMPETMPTRPPRYTCQSFWVRTDPQSGGGAVGTAKGLVRPPNSRWSVQPSIPTTTYSPTSVIPVHLVLTPPGDSLRQTYHVLIRMALVRREHATHNPEDLRDRDGTKGLIKEVEILNRYAWFESVDGQEVVIPRAVLPLMPQQTAWTHGYSTVLNVGPMTDSLETEMIAVSSTFHLAITFAFLAISPDTPTLSELVDRPLPPLGVWSEPTLAHSKHYLGLDIFKRNFPGSVRTLPLPIVIGSVSEPRGAMHLHRWSDLHLYGSSPGAQVGRMVDGEAYSCENGWIEPPPCYGDAIVEVPYDW